MSPEHREELRVCAFCPNPCRHALAADAPAERESQTPSALALLALHVADGSIGWDDRSVQRSLDDLQPAESCRAACVYHFDIPARVREVTQAARRR